MFRPRCAVSVQHRRSDPALPEAAGEELYLPSRRRQAPGEFVSWLWGTIPMAESPGEPEPPSPTLSVSPGPLHPHCKVPGC